MAEPILALDGLVKSYGALPVTTLELAHRLRSVREETSTHGG